MLGSVGGCLEPTLVRKGAKNRGWFFRAVEAQRVAAANTKIDEYDGGGRWECMSMLVCEWTLVVGVCPSDRFLRLWTASRGRGATWTSASAESRCRNELL